MNFTTAALLLLAWQLFSSPNTSKTNFTNFLSDDTKNILDCVSQLSSGNSSDKMGAILQMMNNPVFTELTRNMFGKKEPPPQDTTGKKEQQDFTNDEGYKFEQPSASSQEFFRPIENIADPEVKNKLYKFFENWYVS